MEKAQVDEMIDRQHALQTQLWEGQYYTEGYPTIRLLGDITLAIFREKANNEQ